MYQIYNNYCNQVQYTERYRELPEIYTNNKYIDFSTNDYLGLSNNSELFKAAKLAAIQYGIGATGSRLLSGNKKLFIDLEQQIALDKNTETALILNSGFQANLTVLASLLDQNTLQARPVVFFDKLNHASLYQAIFLSGAELIRYNHNNINHLSRLLEKFNNTNRPKFIVTETVFGMDGDLLPIQEIYNLAKKHNAFLYLDEAHATGIFGIHGYGLSTNIDLSDIPHLIMGTFSKALGCSGAYIASSYIIKNYIINKAAGVIYSTAISPMLAGAAAKAWALIKTFTKKRNKLLNNALYLRNMLTNLGFNIGSSVCHIIPIILEQEREAVHTKNILLKHGIIVSAIRPPTVPPKTSRLRIALTVNHTQEHIEYLINTLKKI